MEYNLAGLRQRVLDDKLDDDEFDPKIVERFLNDTQREIFNQYELPFQEKIFEGVVPAGSTMFQLPSDLAQLQTQSLLGVPGFASNNMAFRDFFKLYPDAVNETAAVPSIWTQYAGNILLNTPTDIDYTLTIYYIKTPSKLEVDNDVPEIPEEFSELLVLGAYIRCLKRNEDFDMATYVEVEYNKQLDLLVSRYGFRNTSGPIKMKNQQIVVRSR